MKLKFFKNVSFLGYKVHAVAQITGTNMVLWKGSSLESDQLVLES